MTMREPQNIEAAAKLLADWINYKWDGVRKDGRIADRGYPQWSYNGIGDLHFQGTQQDLRDLAERIAATVSGEYGRKEKE